MSTQPFDEANDFLFSGGVPSLKYETAGTSHTGKIISAEVQQQREIDTGKPKYWEGSGKPMMQIKVVLQTDEHDSEIEDDDGTRADYIRGNKLTAVQAAVRKARAKLAPDGVLTITYTGDGQPKTRGFNAPKLYVAAYTPPSPAAVEIDDVLGAPDPQPAANGKLPPGMTQEEWAALPQVAKEALAQLHNLPPF